MRKLRKFYRMSFSILMMGIECIIKIITLIPIFTFCTLIILLRLSWDVDCIYNYMFFKKGEKYWPLTKEVWDYFS